jgi:hypothetical protein
MAMRVVDIPPLYSISGIPPFTPRWKALIHVRVLPVKASLVALTVAPSCIPEESLNALLEESLQNES